jgi:hypothetical protein
MRFIALPGRGVLTPFFETAYHIGELGHETYSFQHSYILHS